MSAPNENPFDRYGIDPREGPEGITERMRELIEDAPDEATRDAVRAAWEALTRDPRGRAHLALRTHPRSTRSVPRRPVRQRATGVGATPEPRDYVGAPSLEATLDRLQEAGVEHTHTVVNHDDSRFLGQGRLCRVEKVFGRCW